MINIYKLVVYFIINIESAFLQIQCVKKRFPNSEDFRCENFDTIEKHKFCLYVGLTKGV